jgi:ATP dependent DNA ligase domain
VLAVRGEDHRRLPYITRRARLERLAAAWAPPLQLCPSTADRAEALPWYEDYRAAGIEGLVVKSAHGRYLAGRSDWIKVNSVRLMILKCRQSLVWRSLPCPRCARHVLRTGRRPRRRGVAVSPRQRLPSTRFGRALGWLALSKIEWMT